MASSPPSPPQPEPSPDEFYKYTLQNIEREESLIDHRISWMLTSQGFLFAALALLAKTNGNSPTIATLSMMTPYGGLMVAILSFVGIHAAYLSIGNLLKVLKRRPEWASYPRVTTDFASRLGRLCGYGLPLLFIIIWLILISQSPWVQSLWPFG